VSHNGETVLLLRVAEKCVQAPGKIRVPVYNFENGRPVPGIKEFDKNDPYLKLKDTRGVVYKGKDYLSSLSHIRLARSRDGINFKVEETPFICPHDDDSEYGTEDARVLKFENRYYINYSIVSQDSWCTALSVTEDFKTHKRLGIIFHPENKDVAIFPEKIKGKYAALHRPNNSGFGKPSIWYAESPDLLHWGMHRRLLRPRNTSYESMKIGGGAPPLKTPEGWLCVYHAKGDNQRYSLFPLLLDLEEPWKIIRNPEKPIFEPAMEYERDGFFGNVVFTNGMLEKEGLLYMYYGASDEFSCLATIKVQDLLDAVM
jgi:predicted GH43/DUF377 family glycosyl hydrolase